MRVLQLGPYAPPHGGVQANLSAIRDALLARSDTAPVVVITRASAAEPEIDIYRPAGPFSLVKHLLRRDFDLVHLHVGGNLTGRLLMLGLICAWLPGRPSVLTFHSGGYPSTPAGQSAKHNSWRGFVLRQLDRVIGVNPAIIEMFQKFGLSDDKVRLILPHAIPRVDRSLALPSVLQDFLDRHEPTLVSVGGLEPEYDLPAQVELMTPLRREFPGAGLILIGSGSLEPDLLDLIKGSAAHEHILLVGDLAHATTLRVLIECDLMLRTTLYDGDSISVREALALGLPVVATDNAMRPPRVNLVPARDPDGLLRTVNEVLHRPPVAAESDSDDNIAKVLALYDELLRSAE